MFTRQMVLKGVVGCICTVVFLMGVSFKMISSVHAAQQSKKPMFLNIATGGVGGTGYVGGAAMMKILNEEVPYLKVTSTPGGGEVNVKTLESGETKLILTVWTMSYRGWIGQSPFKRRMIKSRAVCNTFPMFVSILVRKSSDIYTVPDLLKKKRVCVGRQGHSTVTNIAGILKEYGITYDDINKAGGEVVYWDFQNAANAMMDGSLDAFGATTASVHAPFLGIAEAFPVRLIPFDVKKIQSYAKKNPGWTTGEIRGGLYRGQDEPVTVMASWCGLGASIDLTEDEVYDITKVLYKRRQEIADTHPSWKSILEDENLFKGIPIPFHPGAKKFWRERGFEKEVIKVEEAQKEFK